MRPDGSDKQVLYAFDSGDNSMPNSGYGLQWVPGEVDRIIYTGNNDQAYVLSTVDATPPQPLGLMGSGATSSPDIIPRRVIREPWPTSERTSPSCRRKTGSWAWNSTSNPA